MHWKFENDKLRAASHQYKAKCESQRASLASFKGSSSLKARWKSQRLVQNLIIRVKEFQKKLKSQPFPCQSEEQQKHETWDGTPLGDKQEITETHSLNPLELWKWPTVPTSTYSKTDDPLDWRLWRRLKGYTGLPTLRWFPSGSATWSKRVKS